MAGGDEGHGAARFMPGADPLGFSGQSLFGAQQGLFPWDYQAPTFTSPPSPKLAAPAQTPQAPTQGGYGWRTFPQNAPQPQENWRNYIDDTFGGYDRYIRTIEGP